MGTSRMKKKEAMHASRLVVPMEAAPTLRVSRYSVIFFLTQGSFVKILACNLTRYWICSPYCCHTYNLNILGTYRGFGFIFMELGCDMEASEFDGI
jgi:hypothetical protein